MTEVILVNEKDEAIGTMEKMEAHQKAALHRAISVFIFNSNAEMLLQRRALDKYHSGGLWTNACCSHPSPGELTMDAASRRLKEEMGFTTPLQYSFTFTYRSAFENGLSEHEVDHVFVGTYDGTIQPDPAEVAEFKFLPMNKLKELVQHEPQTFTTWFKIALPLLEKNLSSSLLNGNGK